MGRQGMTAVGPVERKECRERPVILLVEDEMIIAFDLHDRLADCGYEVDGPYPSVARAMSAIGEVRPEAAILDVQLTDGDVMPLADRLAEMNVPIIFHSGHAKPEFLKQRYPDAAICAKPCSVGTLEDSLRNMLVHSR